MLKIKILSEKNAKKGIFYLKRFFKFMMNDLIY